MLELLWSNHLLQLLYTSLGIQWVGWAVSAYFHTEKFYDLTGTRTVRHLSNWNIIIIIIIILLFLPVLWILIRIRSDRHNIFRSRIGIGIQGLQPNSELDPDLYPVQPNVKLNKIIICCKQNNENYDT
jgi:hypothetical protein